MTGLEAMVTKAQLASSGKQDGHYKRVTAKHLSSCHTILIAFATTCHLLSIDH